MVEFVFKMVNFTALDEARRQLEHQAPGEFCISNDEFCIQNDEFCI